MMGQVSVLAGLCGAAAYGGLAAQGQHQGQHP